MHAFQTDKLEKDYSKLAEQIINYANGLPLALKIIGFDLCGKSIHEWKSALEKYKNIPHKKIQEKLKISYDGLEKTEKVIFLDISCFFKGFSKDFVVNILDACNLYPDYGIKKLINKCLLTIDQFGQLSCMICCNKWVAKSFNKNQKSLKIVLGYGVIKMLMKY